MSNVPANDTETQFDYWEFVHCAICFLPFIPDPINAPAGPPTVPFWLTECGHTLCNNHINPDQSCGACGAVGVQLVPLQRDMLPPMCDWFRSFPHGLDALASAARFQQETMASLVRFYKRKCIQQQATISKTKDAIAENKVLRNQIEQLQQENTQLRSGHGGGSDRQHQNQQQAFARDRYETRYHDRDRLSSSPRSVTTSAGPPRLILPQDHPQPVHSNVATTSNTQQTPQSHARPGPSTFEFDLSLKRIYAP
ncbi:hypothetical protein BU17DRAFT_57727 [Hysterangium stoloniferum]|nr:hypothetical protein BU17DRAFT_57727 [Hysterangium stoloniferum]